MKKTDLERVKKILSLWDDLKTQIQMHGITKELLMQDKYTQWAVTTPLYNIGEQVYQITGELKAQYPNIPWSIVSGLRHRLVHEYENTNWNIISTVIFEEMDEFIEQIETVLENLNA